MKLELIEQAFDLLKPMCETQFGSLIFYRLNEFKTYPETPPDPVLRLHGKLSNVKQEHWKILGEILKLLDIHRLDLYECDGSCEPPSYSYFGNSYFQFEAFYNMLQTARIIQLKLPFNFCQGIESVKQERTARVENIVDENLKLSLQSIIEEPRQQEITSTPSTSSSDSESSDAENDLYFYDPEQTWVGRRHARFMWEVEAYFAYKNSQNRENAQKTPLIPERSKSFKELIGLWKATGENKRPIKVEDTATPRPK